jgi:serine/threonine protein kinase/formylglycine-generating enzyme required for sulfatase activity
MYSEEDDSVDSLIAAVARVPIRPEAWTPPAELDEYRLIKPLGRGGMGSVWLAEDRLLERLVALKFIAHAEPDRWTRGRFAIEARAAARLAHVNVVTVHRFGEIAGRPYLVSEYIRGESLDRLAKPVSIERALELGVALSRGLAAAHRHGIVHRDIKPANAILTAEGDVKLVDFGLAKFGIDDSAEARALVPVADRLTANERGNGRAARANATTRDAADDRRDAPRSDGGPRTAPVVRIAPNELLTAPGEIAGTPRYLAPEVRAGQPATPRSDVYQLGCILYELVAGRAPLLDVRDGEDPSLAPRVGRDGARFGAIVDRCLRRDPAARFGSGDELREALETLAAPAVGGELPEGNPYRGLVAFDAEHRALFFGRGPDIRAVIERLRESGFVLVTGDSGVGKSSLCRAGVVPSVVDGALDDRRTWTAVQLVPGQRPLATLASLLASHAQLDEDALLAMMRDDPGRVPRELRRAGGEDRGLLVFIDQFEELITLADRAEAARFADVLGHLVVTPGVRVLATVRSDFLMRIAELPGLGLDITRALYLLRPLTAEGAREAVVGPARAKGVELESDELVETLVGSVTELPLLAFTLAQLWDARDPGSATISARSLEAIGGVHGALARHAEAVLDSLLPAQRELARTMLLRLVTPERTRARRTAAELGDRAVLDALVRGRLLVARGEEPPLFELAHEQLIAAWPRFARWIAEATEAIAVHARLTAAVATWEQLGRSKEALWRKRQLGDLSLLAADALAPAESEFVTRSRRAERRRRYAWRTIAIAVPLIAATFYGGARYVARRDLARTIAASIDEAERAQHAARTTAADGAKLAASAFAQFDANQLPDAETTWAAARAKTAEAQRAYTQASRALEAALLLDTSRSDVRRALAEVTFERLDLAERDEERDELTARLPLYDDGTFMQRLSAPATLDLALEPGTSVTLADGSTEMPLPPVLAPGPHVLVARAPGRTTVRLPLVLAAQERRRVELALPPADRVPAGFVYIPAGTFLYGSRDDDSMRRFFDAAPMHERTTDAFLIARTETTYAEWIAWLDSLPAAEQQRRAPNIEASATVQEGGALALARAGDTWTLAMTPSRIEYKARAGSPIEYSERTVNRQQDWLRMPVSGITPEDAIAYASWLDRTGRVPHARLCDELEWERAARGVDGRSTPSGRPLAPTDANIDTTYGRKDGGFGPDVVSSHPASTSPFGLADTAGNVWEITRATMGADFVMKGGAFYVGTRSAHLANRQMITSTFRHLHAGVRICADVR